MVNFAGSIDLLESGVKYRRQLQHLHSQLPTPQNYIDIDVPFQRSSGVTSSYNFTWKCIIFQCRKPVGHLCCKLYCFLRVSSVLSLSFIQPDFRICHEQLMICVTVCSWICVTIHQACFPSLHNWDVIYLIPGVAVKRVLGIQPARMLFEHGIGQSQLVLQVEESSSCSLDVFAGGSLLLTLVLKSPITSSMSPMGACLTAWDKSVHFFLCACCRWSIHLNQSNVSWFCVESHNKDSVADWFVSNKSFIDIPMNSDCHSWHALSRSTWVCKVAQN